MTKRSGRGRKKNPIGGVFNQPHTLDQLPKDAATYYRQALSNQVYRYSKIGRKDQLGNDVYQRTFQGEPDGFVAITPYAKYRKAVLDYARKGITMGVPKLYEPVDPETGYYWGRKPNPKKRNPGVRVQRYGKHLEVEVWDPKENRWRHQGQTGGRSSVVRKAPVGKPALRTYGKHVPYAGEGWQAPGGLPHLRNPGIAKGTRVTVRLGTPWPRDAQQIDVTGKVVRVRGSVATVDVEQSRANPGGHPNEDVMYVDVPVSALRVTNPRRGKQANPYRVEVHSRRPGSAVSAGYGETVKTRQEAEAIHAREVARRQAQGRHIERAEVFEVNAHGRRKANPATARNTIWGLYALDKNGKRTGEVTFALEREHLPIGGWVAQGFEGEKVAKVAVPPTSIAYICAVNNSSQARHRKPNPGKWPRKVK